MGKKKKGLVALAVVVVAAGAAFGVLDKAGIVGVATVAVLGSLLWGSIKKGRVQKGFGINTGESLEDMSYEERIAASNNEKEIIEILKERERDIFNNNIYMNPQNTIWDTYEIERGEGETTSVKGFLVQDKQTNQDMLFHVDEDSGEIKRRAQRLDDLELYNLFEHSSFIQSVEKHKFSGNNRVVQELKRLMKNKASQQPPGLTLDKDEYETKSKEDDDIPRTDKWNEVG